MGIKMIVTKSWAMPNKNTFTIKPIKELILRLISDYCKENASQDKIVILDPFSNVCPLEDLIKNIDERIIYITNDLDETMPSKHHLEAVDFLQKFDDERVDIILFDPPFSPRQVSECYKKLGKTVNMETTQASFWSKIKTEIGRVVKLNGITMSFGWNSNGIGKNNGFEQFEILMVAHGGNHQDTITTCEKKTHKPIIKKNQTEVL